MGHPWFQRRGGSWLARVAAGLLLALAALAGGARADEPPRYTLAVVPNLPPLTLHRAWTPFVEGLSAAAGVRIQLKLYERLQTFLDASAAGRPDLLYSPPNMFYEAHRAQGYVPLVRGGRMLAGVVFVRKDSPYRTVQDLEGKTVAFVGEKNLCAVITRHALATTGTAIDYNATFSGSTINVAKAVVLRKADAGATLDVGLASDVPELAEQLRVVLQTPPVAPHALAAHPRVPAEVRERVAAAVLAMAEAEEGRALLAAVKLADPRRADVARDYGVFAAICSGTPAACR